MARHLLILLFLVFFSISSFGQQGNKDQHQDNSLLPFLSAVNVTNDYIDLPNITYVTANHYEAKLDLYRPASSAKPTPVVIHGGGWVAGTKEQVVTWTLPFLQMGFAVINVEYRLANTSLAPAAVEDCLCVLHWVGRNAAAQNFDLNKVVVTGASAGGHLALTTAMIPTSAGFESECANDDDASGGAGAWPNHRAKVAAVVNWFGITDVADLIQGENTRAYAVTWLGSQANREEMARKMSPLTYIRHDLPPILTIHGDHDTFVPYSHAVRLHQALTQAGVKNQLLTIPGKGHGNLEENTRAWQAVRAFLGDAGIIATKE
ncbi:MAG TPA: alpha/beta hydrolase [Terriglobales bacterium]|nr:alpha/beta hydrolase [Terriglobales bacterium]